MGMERFMTFLNFSAVLRHLPTHVGCSFSKELLMLLETSAFRGKRMNLKRSKEYEPCLFSVWLVTCPKLFFPLGQDLPISRQKHLEEVCLWRTDISNLSNDFKWYRKCEYDGVIQIKLNVGQICLLSLFCCCLCCYLSS